MGKIHKQMNTYCRIKIIVGYVQYAVLFISLSRAKCFPPIAMRTWLTVDICCSQLTSQMKTATGLYGQHITLLALRMRSSLIAIFRTSLIFKFSSLVLCANAFNPLRQKAQWLSVVYKHNIKNTRTDHRRKRENDKEKCNLALPCAHRDAVNHKAIGPHRMVTSCKYSSYVCCISLENHSIKLSKLHSTRWKDGTT